MKPHKLAIIRYRTAPARELSSFSLSLSLSLGRAGRSRRSDDVFPLHGKEDKNNVRQARDAVLGEENRQAMVSVLIQACVDSISSPQSVIVRVHLHLGICLCGQPPLMQSFAGCRTRARFTAHHWAIIVCVLGHDSDDEGKYTTAIYTVSCFYDPITSPLARAIDDHERSDALR